ncbi:mitogen-activated protein kinase 1, putative [Plasmodium knowlesi strain H]|uniref:Mitogen-activated protein kinase n=1 Tax=Plasmodium knowlesi (strain H) TaxID=5851 RepID=A0A1A7VCD6_PLAKH|nr:mitogen-activated protein kinase 1, putative [Plasmodium knowlesi strain H]SBO22808.1 mitogen-activated protein kinase 1, putative [Plasmodium knowlesi strain H]
MKKEGQQSKDEQVDECVLKKYDIVRKIGKGAYGIVYKAKCKRNRKIVAVKKIFGAFQNSTDAQRTFREIMFLYQLNGHDNIITLMDVIKAKNDNDIYLVFDYMETDLHEVIKADLLEEIHKRYIIYQLLRALKYIHSGMLLHRDIKPSNILLNSECHIKVGDFGLARSISTELSENKIPVLTDYVATRWYRAPEILLGSTNYTEGVDMWSLGCIMAELLLGRPLFRGNSTMNQLEKIIQLIGKPTKKDMEDIKSPFTDTIISSFVDIKRKNFSDIFSKASVEALDLLKQLLQFNPTKRISAENALKHKYVEQFHSIIDEPVCRHIITIPVDDSTKYRVSFYRNIVYYDIMRRKKYHPGGRSFEGSGKSAGQVADHVREPADTPLHQNITKDESPGKPRQQDQQKEETIPSSSSTNKGNMQSTTPPQMEEDGTRITSHRGKCAPKIRSTQSIHDEKSTKRQPKKSDKRERAAERRNGNATAHPNEKHYYEVPGEGKTGNAHDGYLYKEMRNAQGESREIRTKTSNGDATRKLHEWSNERGQVVASATSVNVTRRNDDKGGSMGERRVDAKTANVIRGERMVRIVNRTTGRMVRSHFVNAADVEAVKHDHPRIQSITPQKKETVKWRKRGGDAGAMAKRVDFCGAHCHDVTGKRSSPKKKKKKKKKSPSKQCPSLIYNI